jgi:hypothetical protein
MDSDYICTICKTAIDIPVPGKSGKIGGWYCGQGHYLHKKVSFAVGFLTMFLIIVALGVVKVFMFATQNPLWRSL